MTPEAKEIVNGTINGEKPLGVARRLKPAHLAFLLPEAETEAMIQPHGVTNDLGRETMIPIRGRD